MVLATRSKTAKENKANYDAIKPDNVIKKLGKVKEQNNNASYKDKTELKRKLLTKNEPKSKVSKANNKEEKSEKATLFCKNLSFLVTEDDLMSFFKKSTSARIIINRQGLSKGYGFVDFNNEEDLKEALEIKNLELLGRVMELKRAVKDYKANDQAENLSKNTLFIKGTSKDINEDFFKFEGMSEVRVMKGFCYVEFESNEMAEKVFQSTRDGLNIDGNHLEVSYAIKRGRHKNATPISKTKEQ